MFIYRLGVVGVLCSQCLTLDSVYTCTCNVITAIHVVHGGMQKGPRKAS
jgi:hypothetical protein